MLVELDGATRLGVALLIGLAVGLERQWSGHASGPSARFAGLRTFSLLGVLGGAGGLLAAQHQEVLGSVALAAGVAMVVTAYGGAIRRDASDLDATTEVAALVVISLGALAGTGWLLVASPAGAIVVFILNQKRRLHEFVKGIERNELQAGLQFAVLAIVVLPLLPPGPYLGPLAVRPRALWAVVLAFCALNFASYLARRMIGSSRGYGVAGALGGLMSSTAVTLAYARRSRTDGESPTDLARGVIAACTVMIPRVLVVSTILNPRVALAALLYLGPALIAGTLLVLVARKGDSSVGAPLPEDGKSPLRFWSALRMAAAFQLAMSAIALLRARLGDIGIYGGAVALGLTDMDALTVSMSSRSGPAAAIAARALGVGMLWNTLFKLSMSLVLGSPAFRRRAAAGLATLALLTIAALRLL